MSYCIINNRLIKNKDALLPLSDRGTRLGDGIFETIHVNHTTPYLWHEHIARLERGLTTLDISFATDNLYELSQSLIKKNNHEDGILRIMVTRGSGSIGYTPTYATQPTLVIEYTEKPKKNDTPYALWHSENHAIPSQCFPAGIKSNQALPYILSIIEAQKNNCQQSIITNIDGSISETSSANIFWTKGDILYTPSLNCNIIHGTIRNKIIQLSSIPVKEGEYPLQDIKNADEVFITNNGLLIHPIANIAPIDAHYNCANAPITQHLTQLLENDILHYEIT